MRYLSGLITFLAATCAGSASAAPYLYAWASYEDLKQGDFLAVFEANPNSPDYGKLLATVPTKTPAGAAHHIEYEMPRGSTLFANDWGSGESFIFNIRNRSKPVLAGKFEHAGDFIYPHSFARLPNGHVLATFQSIGKQYAPPGGLVELNDKGQLVRSARSETPDIPTAINWPYSLLVVPAADRVVTTSTDMGRGDDWKSPETRHIQIWTIKDLKLMASIPLPPPPAPSDKANTYPAEPRMLADGSVYVNTFTCGLYRIEGLTGAKPSARFVYAFPGGGEDAMCAVPVVYGKYWIQTVGAINGLIVLDVSDPANPKEVSRLSLPMKFHMPHWIGADRANGRIAVTGGRASWLAMLKFDEATGALSIDERFGDGGEVQFDRPDWPHGEKGRAIVHGVVFTH
jgi:hypothetical protein